MRITRDTLIKAAKTAVQQRTLRDRHIVCVYLTGSLIDDLPLLGGTADIDLVFVHDNTPPAPREIIRLTPDVHLDLAHHDQSIYNQPRDLRLDPWVGSFLIKDPLVLYSTQHWFEYTQATVFANFYKPDTILLRAQPFADQARQIWLDFQLGFDEPGPERIWKYLHALELSSNALVLLDGTPLTERRFLLQFPERMSKLGYPGMAAVLKDMILAENPREETIREWMQSWNKALQIVSTLPNSPVALHPERLVYYTRAVETLIGDENAAALWILLRTWTRAIGLLETDSKFYQEWQSCIESLGLGEHEFKGRLHHLDVYLDQMEEIIEKWCKQNGIDTNEFNDFR